MRKPRDYGYDNLKCILIFCVVLGHLLEFCPVARGSDLYRLIYFFHMPFFLFLSGYFTKGQVTAGEIVPQVVRYGVFQIAYLTCFASPYQFTTPYWILWYAMALLCYQLILPLCQTGSTLRRLAAVGVTFAISLLIGYDDTVGYYLSLSRFFVFQPFFLLGHYFRQEEGRLKAWYARHVKAGRVLRLLTAPAVLLTLPTVFDPAITAPMLYGAAPYAALGYSALVRLRLAVVALLWIAFFLAAVKPLVGKKLPLISMVGANTLPVFLFHGFVVRLAQKYWIASLGTWPAVLLFTAGCLLLFGNPLASVLLHPRLPRRREGSGGEG